MSSKFTMNREILVRVFFFGTFAFLLYQLFLLSKPFLPALLVSAILTMTFSPFYRRLHHRVKSANGAALIMTLTVVLAAVLPLVGFVWLVIRESGSLIPAIQGVMAEIKSGNDALLQEKLPPFLYESFDQISTFFNGVNVDIKSFVLDNAREIGSHLSSLGSFVARNAIFTFFKLMILVLSLFFMFRDGERFVDWVLKLIPMEHSHKHAIAKSAYETFRAVSIGVFLTASAQGLAATIGFFIAGIRLPILLGLTTAMVSLLGASFVICIPVALFVMIDDFSKGLFLLIWGAGLVGWLDNLLKPILIGSRARMPFILVFFSILGGLKMYGLVGLILGPVLVACVLAFIRVYREAYSS